MITVRSTSSAAVAATATTGHAAHNTHRYSNTLHRPTRARQSLSSPPVYPPHCSGLLIIVNWYARVQHSTCSSCRIPSHANPTLWIAKAYPGWPGKEAVDWVQYLSLYVASRLGMKRREWTTCKEPLHDRVKPKISWWKQVDLSIIAIKGR